jgi:hypothetical protein
VFDIFHIITFRLAKYPYNKLIERMIIMLLRFSKSLIIALVFSLFLTFTAFAHYYSSGWSLYSMTYKSVDSDNGICYQGATNWTTAAGTTMTQNTSSLNSCYYRYYPETWYGLYTKYTSYFTVQLNKDKLLADFPGAPWNSSVSSSTHEFGHAQFLNDIPSGYGNLSIMSYERDRTTITTPQSHDTSDLYSLRNP